MRVFNRVRILWRNFFHRERTEQELNEQIRSCIERQAAEKLRGGPNVEEGRLASQIEMGGVKQPKEQVREGRAGAWVDTLLRDTRFGLRLLRKNPSFTIIATLTLALGIGVTSAVFSVVDRALLRNLPYLEADRLVMVGIVAPIEDWPFMFASDYVALHDYEHPFASLTSWSGVTDCDITDLNPARAQCALVDASFLPTFGVQLFLGRSFTRDEDRPNSPRVGLLSYGMWLSRFGADPNIVGKTLSLDGQAVQIVGVLRRDFELPNLAHADFVLPLRFDETALRPGSTGPILTVFAKLKPAISSPAQARVQLQPFFDKMIAGAPPQFQKEIHLRVQSLRDFQVQDVRPALWILFGAALTVLLLATSNVANLLLARAVSRQREMGIRVALGASQGRLVLQMLTESVLLSLTGGALGCFLAYLLIRLFVVIAPTAIPRIEHTNLDFRVLTFAMGVSVVCGIVFGLSPAFVTSGAHNLARAKPARTHRFIFRLASVGTQLALSLVLLTSAVLLLRTLQNLENVPLGMITDHVATARISLGATSYSDPSRQMAFLEEFESRLQRLPGVTAFAMSDSLPPGGQRRTRPFFALEVEGQPRFEKGTGGTIVWRAVTPGYFAALRIPIIEGRGFNEADRIPNNHVIVLSRSLARLLFPDSSPLGKNIRLEPEGPWYTVIGATGDVKNAGLTESSAPEYYLARKHEINFGLQGLMQPDAIRRVAVIIRSPLPAKSVANWVRDEVASLDPGLPVETGTLDQGVAQFTERAKFNTVLLSLFAALAMALAAVGLYGLVSFLVVERTQEIGIRMALGATSASVMRLILRRVMRLALVGAAVGAIGSLIATRFMRTLLFRVPPGDPVAFEIAILLLVACAFLACYVPARRAARLDPIVALRYE
jgi:putative ABC transport system permease protein